MTKHKVKPKIRGQDELSKVTTKMGLSHHLPHVLQLEGASLRGQDEQKTDPTQKSSCNRDVVINPSRQRRALDETVFAISDFCHSLLYFHAGSREVDQVNCLFVASLAGRA